MRVLIFGFLLVTATAAWADDGFVHVAKDFVADFKPSFAVNSLNASANSEERCGHPPMPGIFLHPQNADDSVVTYRAVQVPPAGDEWRPFLLFHIGLRDGIPWDDEVRAPNGVRFSVRVGGREVFGEERRGEGWAFRAVDLSEWAGTAPDFELRTNAIDGNTNYDWAVFGDPLLISMPLVPYGGVVLPGEGKLAPDFVLAEFEVAVPVTAVLENGGFGNRQKLEPGTHWIPVMCRPAEPVVAREPAAKRMVGARFAPVLVEKELSLSTPLVTAGRSFNVLCRLENTGRGVFIGKPPKLSLEGAAEVSLMPMPTIGLHRGEEKTVSWPQVSIDTPGEYVARAGSLSCRFYVFPAEVPTAVTLTGEASRLNFHVDDAGHAYAIAETRDKSQWLRAASLYPLAQLVLADENGEAARADLRVKDIGRSMDEVVVKMAGHWGGADWPVEVKFSRQSNARFAIEAALTPPRDGALAALYGPTIMVNNRAYAIFPGLEFLKDNEPSSSTRDLARPLNDRRVPAPHKIAAPVMAVEGNDTLVGLLWDMRAEWAPGEPYTAAKFLAPDIYEGGEGATMALFAPSVGKYVNENEYAAARPFPMKKGEPVRVRSTLVVDHRSNYEPGSVARMHDRAGFVLQAMRHWFEAYGFPEPSPQPRDWDAERALCRHACLHSVWSDEPLGWSHCVGWAPGLHVGLATPLLLDLRAGMPEADRTEVTRRIDAVIEESLKRNGPGSLWSNAGCHIMLAELPFYRGYVPESLAAFRDHARKLLDARENGLWVWRTTDPKRATLGRQGDHTLGQAALPTFKVLRAARMTGDPELAQEGIQSAHKMHSYAVPRGAQMWECPMYQPDILAAAYAVRACCEAYRLTGEESWLEEARYWAFTGLPFLYLWEMDGYPTMKYNVISVIGSTFYTHSWLGMPVVWCGLVYAYALQDLAEFDNSFDWRTVAQGITNSAMWQQYTEGPSKGAYPDSWNMIKNKPNPADINPENIYVNEFRLRGQSPEIRFARIERDGQCVMVNSAADIEMAEVSAAGVIGLVLTSPDAVYTLVAPIEEPRTVEGAGLRLSGSGELDAASEGWLYESALDAAVFKTQGRARNVRLSW